MADEKTSEIDDTVVVDGNVEFNDSTYQKEEQSMKAVYWQKGQSLDYTNTTDAVIEAGTIITAGDLIGIAGSDIEPGETGSIHVEGVFRMPKKDTTETAMGTPVYFGTDGITATSGTSVKAAGYAAEASAAGETEILVKLNK